MTWAHQFHFQDDAPTLHQFIDEDRRRQLTREQVPIEDFSPLLMDSLTDPDGAFAAALHGLHYGGELQDLQIDGDTATGKLIDRSKRKKTEDDYSDPQESAIGFRKDKQGWVIDLNVERKEKDTDEPPIEREPMTEAQKKAQELKAEQPKPWKNKPAPKYEKPIDALLAERAAFAENDPEKLWHTFTKRQREWYMRSQMLMLVEAGGGDLIMAWYCDMSKMKDKQGPHTARNREIYASLPPVDKDDETETSLGHEKLERAKHERERLWDSVIVSMIYDEQAYFSAVVKRVNLRLRQQQIRNPELDYDEMKEVSIQGDRAVGIMHSPNGYDYNAHFARENGSWKMDLENADEHIAEWRKDELESYQRRKESEAERKKEEEKEKQSELKKAKDK